MSDFELKTDTERPHLCCRCGRHIKEGDTYFVRREGSQGRPFAYCRPCAEQEPEERK